MDINGKVIAILPAYTFNTKNGQKTKYGFVIETNDQYPKKVCLNCFGDERWKALGIVQGGEYNLSIEVSSREYNGRWFTEATCWRAVNVGKPQAQPMVNNTQAQVTIPSNGIPYKETQESNVPQDESDLPF